MSQHQKNADNMVLMELEKQKARQKQLDVESKRIAEALRPQTSIDDLVHQTADEVAHHSDDAQAVPADQPKVKPKAVDEANVTETLSEAKKAH